jgi:hypothetical protein
MKRVLVILACSMLACAACEVRNNLGKRKAMPTPSTRMAMRELLPTMPGTGESEQCEVCVDGKLGACSDLRTMGCAEGRASGLIPRYEWSERKGK